MTTVKVTTSIKRRGALWIVAIRVEGEDGEGWAESELEAGSEAEAHRMRDDYVAMVKSQTERIN